MPDIPQAAIAAAVRALRAHPWPDGETTEAQIATLVLEAAAPLLAEAWGAFECEPLVIDSGHPSAADRALVARATGGGIRSREVQVRFEDGPDLTRELDEAEAIAATAVTEWGMRHDDCLTDVHDYGRDEKTARQSVADHARLNGRLVRRSVIYGPWEET